MPGSTPATSQLDWLSSTTAMIVLSWSKATRDLLKSFSWGIGALRQLFASDDGAISSPPAPSHLPGGGRWIRTIGPPPFFGCPVDPRAIHLPQYKPARPRQGPMVRIHLPPAKSPLRTSPLLRSEYSASAVSNKSFPLCDQKTHARCGSPDCPPFSAEGRIEGEAITPSRPRISDR